MIKIKRDQQGMYQIIHGKTVIAGFDAVGFRDLMNAMKEFIESTNPQKYARKKARQERRIARAVARIERWMRWKASISGFLARLRGFFRLKTK